MKHKTILFITLVLLTGICLGQNSGKMLQKKVKVREGKVEINYYEQGNGHATLLFLHGWCIDGRYWKDQLSHFGKDYRVLALDLPGFGKSTAQRCQWTIEEYALDVVGFIEKMHLSNIVLIGHSMSGEIMLQASLANPSCIIGLIGIDNFKFVEVAFTPEQKEMISEHFDKFETDFQNAAPEYAEYMLFHPSSPPAVKERVKANFRNADPVVALSTFVGLIQFSGATSSKLEQLNHKLYLINSDAVPTNTQGLNTRCKMGYSLETIHATGHYPMVEKAREFNTILEGVIEKIH